MTKKSLNEQFIKYAKKKKIFDKKLFKQGHDFEQLISMSITESLKKVKTRQVADLGFFRKREKMIAGKLEKLIDFIANENILKKIIRGYLITSTRPKGPSLKKVILVALPLLLLPILGFTGWKFLVPQASALLERRAGSSGKGPGADAKLTGSTDGSDAESGDSEEGSLAANGDVSGKDEADSGDSAEESETVMFNNKPVKKEKVDFEAKEITSNKDRSIIIKTENVNDTDLKEGESRSSIVQINGEFYNKNIYIVKDGDTLWDIAAVFLHNPFLWPNIHKDNAYIKNPHLILPGYKLTIYSKHAKN